MKKAHRNVYPSTGEKKWIDEEIFRKSYDGVDRCIPFDDFPPNLKPNDKILIHSDEGYQSENNAWEPYTELVIYRPRLETDEEFEERKKRNKEYLDKRKADRRELYLKLKAEFENE